MGSKTRQSSYCTKRGNNTVNLVTSRKINTRVARPITLQTLILLLITPLTLVSLNPDSLRPYLSSSSVMSPLRSLSNCVNKSSSRVLFVVINLSKSRITLECAYIQSRFLFTKAYLYFSLKNTIICKYNI